MLASLMMICTFLINAQSPITQIGGRAHGLSGCSLTLKDVWAQYHNQAGIAYLKGIRIGGAYQNSFLVKELSVNSFAFALPLKSGVFGINYYYFGYPKFNENKFGISFAKKLGNRLALGGQIDYFQTFIQGEYEQKGVPAGELGIIAEPIDNLFIAAHVFNIWNSKLSKEDNLYLPTIFKLGVSYTLYQKALLGIEVEKDLELLPVFKICLDTELIEKFYLRAGIASKPTVYSFGIGYSFSQFNFNLAFSKHPILGYSPSASIIYAFNDRL